MKRIRIEDFMKLTSEEIYNFQESRKSLIEKEKSNNSDMTRLIETLMIIQISNLKKILQDYLVQLNDVNLLLLEVRYKLSSLSK